MQWTPEAEDSLKKVPFFVRKRVRARVEKEAQQAGKTAVSLADVKTTQARYLTDMKSEIKGYQIETCFGPSGCPNRTIISDALFSRIKALVENENLLKFLQATVKGDLKFHHEFRITLADCPNACSQPQIKDIGIIGACRPTLTQAECTQCHACVEACQEDAVRLGPEHNCPGIDAARCLYCGQCIHACPTGTIAEGLKGFRIQLGGKLGRHPQLARELPGIYNEDQVLEIVKDCLQHYKKNSKNGERFGHILTPADVDAIANRYKR